MISDFGCSISDLFNLGFDIKKNSCGILTFGVNALKFRYYKSEIEHPNSEIKLKHYYFCKNILRNGTLQVQDQF